MGHLRDLFRLNANRMNNAPRGLPRKNKVPRMNKLPRMNNRTFACSTTERKMPTKNSKALTFAAP
jgi:hypothetical protein